MRSNERVDDRLMPSTELLQDSKVEAPDQVVWFGAEGNSDYHCAGGWSYPEENGRWSVGAESGLVVKRPPGKNDCLLRMSVTPFVSNGSIKHQTLEIFVNGTSLGRQRVSLGGTIERLVPYWMIRDRDYIILRFYHPDTSNLRLGTVASEERALAFFFVEMSVQPVDEPVAARAYTKIISLGGRCEVAHQINRRFGAKTVPGFFDLLASSIDSVVDVLDSDFENFIVLEQLAPLSNWESNTTHRLLQTRYNIGLVHAFRKQFSVETQIRTVRRQFELAQEYWGDLAEEPGRLLFIHRVNTNPAVEDEFRERSAGPEDAVKLQAAIRRKLPDTTFDLLMVTSDGTFSENWGAPGIMHVVLPDVFPYEWQGDDGEWDEIWRRLGLEAAGAS